MRDNKDLRWKQLRSRGGSRKEGKMLKARKYREVQGSNERQEFRGKKGGRQGLGKSKNVEEAMETKEIVLRKRKPGQKYW